MNRDRYEVCMIKTINKISILYQGHKMNIDLKDIPEFQSWHIIKEIKEG